MNKDYVYVAAHICKCNKRVDKSVVGCSLCGSGLIWTDFARGLNTCPGCNTPRDYSSKKIAFKAHASCPGATEVAVIFVSK